MPQFTFCPQCNTRYDTAGMPAGKRLCCRECRAILSVQDDAASMPTIDPAPGSQQSTLSVADVNGRAAPGQEEPVIQALTDASGEEKYAVEDEIARGGMGMILKALDRDIRRPVAMKVMLRETDENKRARFVEEAQVTGQLEHPNIMPIHELGLDAQGQLFFTMKLVKGRSLADVLKDVGRPSGSPGDPEDRPTLGRLLNAFIAVCNAIAFAHAKGVVHRDLKPANIMLGDYGEVLVMDWGLAKPGAAVASVGSPSWQSDRLEACPTDEESDAKLAGMVRSLREESSGSKTADGVLIGTPHYMPPEQAEGRIEEIDARSDIYSLGAILYEILTLQTPCEGRTIFALVSNVSQGNIRPPHERAPQRNIPPELAAVAMKALARRKEDCYQRVEDLRRDIELYLEGRAVSAKDDTLWEAIVKLVKRNRGASVATALAAAVIVVLVAVGYRLNLQEKRAALEARNEAVAARKLAEKTLADLQAEQQQRQQAEAARRAERKKSVPAFVGAARTALTQMKNDDALAYLRAALDYDPENTEALLLESQLLICLREYAGAVGQLGKYLALKPNDADARKLAELAAQATPGDPAFAPAFSEVFSRQKAHYFVASLSQDTNKLLAAYKQRLDEALPGMNLGEALSVSDSGGFRAVGYPKMGDLTPLMGIPLTELILQNCPVRDLTPLKGMQLTSLRLSGCRNVEDLGPLRDCDKITETTRTIADDSE